MNPEMEAYLRDPEPFAEADYSTLQRIALGEMLKLSAATVDPLVAQIESRYQAGKKKVQDQFEVDRARTQQQYETRRQEIKDQYETRLGDIQADYEGQLGTIKLDSHQAAKRVKQAAEDLETKAEKEYQEKLMVAEFVSEGAVTKSERSRIEVDAGFQRGQAHLNDMAAHAASLLKQYGQKRLAESIEVKTPKVPTKEDPARTYAAFDESAQAQLAILRRVRCAHLFSGPYPVLLAGAFIAVPLIVLGILYQLEVAGLPSVAVGVPVAAGIGLVLVAVLGHVLWKRAKSQLRQAYEPFQSALAGARIALENQRRAALAQIERELKDSIQQKDKELKEAREKFESTKTNVARQRGISLQEVKQRRDETYDRIKQDRDKAKTETEAQHEREVAELEQWFSAETAETQERYDRDMAACQAQYDRAREALEARWDKGLACIEALLQHAGKLDETTVTDWDRLAEDPSALATTSNSAVRFGSLELDWAPLAPAVLDRVGARFDTSGPATVPAILEFPKRCSMLLQSQRKGREPAIESLRTVMARLFTSLPPGRVRFTIFDPVGLGENFAGFMHAGDYLDALVGGRIWTEAAQIRQQLEDLTQHMENVIQKYLRNEFETIEEYNAQAGELAEPYHFLVIADFPTHFNEESARRLSSIVHSGPRCGVHVLVAYDTRQDLPSGIDAADISAGSIHLVSKEGQFVWQHPVLQQFPLALDAPPAEETLTTIMQAVGRAAVETARVEVPFEAIAPNPDQMWSRDSREELRVPLGRTGATRLQDFRLGHGMNQHMLIAGKTGSGKSTLLHVMVTNLALWYGPDQVELYLIDFKQGVEFKTYVTHDLPHARAVAIESDREFGLSILQRLAGEMAHRGDLFRKAGVQDIAAYRDSTGKPLPRTVLIVDEFQVFFSEDDKLAQDAAVLLEQLVRQGRAFGIHVVLGSQTLGGAFGLARSTMGQMAVRIALQCSEADSQLILDDDNVGARLLTRPGEAIYNDAGGAIAGNSPFQTAWLPDSTRDTYLDRLTTLKPKHPVTRQPLIVFEGSVPANIRANRQLAACISSGPTKDVTTPKLWLGDPVVIKEPTAVSLHRQSGANILMIGQRDDVAMHLMSSSLVSLAVQWSPQRVRFVILDGTAPDSPQAGTLQQVTSVLPHDCQFVEINQVGDAITELSQEADRRVEAGDHKDQTVILMVYALQRYRVLRRSEDAFSFSMDQEETGTKPDAQFANILREGPGLGIHVIAWADTLGTLERTLDRQTTREFDHRVLFQMSASDSSNLIDSPAANQLGFHRALLYSEEQGGMEKFRPYAPLTQDWLAELGKALRQNT